MTYRLSGALLVLCVLVSGCAARTERGATTTTSDRLASATVTFNTLQDGKDAKSAISLQLLRSGNELAADAMSVGTEFDDDSTAAPVALALKAPFGKQDTQAGALRLRLTPDGNDTWTFNVSLNLRFADETQQNYAWAGVRLDEKAPERTLVLQGALQTP